jgi:hypothetical protein
LRKMPTNASKKRIVVKKSLIIIRCVCGFEIMLVPNAKVMSAAIEAHMEEHKQKVADLKAAQAEAERIGDYLISQVFEMASKP